MARNGSITRIIGGHGVSVPVRKDPSLRRGQRQSVSVKDQRMSSINRANAKLDDEEDGTVRGTKMRAGITGSKNYCDRQDQVEGKTRSITINMAGRTEKRSGSCLSQKGLRQARNVNGSNNERSEKTKQFTHT